MTWESDLATLTAFRSRLPVPWRSPDLTEAAPDPQVVDAAWSVLRRAFVETPRPRIDRDTNGLVELAAMILGAVGGFGRRALDELALGNPDASNDFWLVPLLLTITNHDHELFFEAVRDALDADESRRVLRALLLVRAGYGGRFPFRITAKQGDVFDAAVTMHKAIGTDDLVLRSALEDYIRPAAR